MRTPAIVLTAHAISLVVSLQVSTLLASVGGIFLTPLVVGLVLLVWWLRSKQIPLKERLGLLALGFAVLMWVIAMLRPTDPMAVVMFMSILTTSSVLVLLLTTRLKWRARRSLVIAVLIVWAAISPMLQITGLTGGLIPKLAWRWTPSSEERLAATPDSALLEVSGTANLPAQPGAGDWPGFRGPERDGRLAGTTFATNWSENPPQELWRRPVGLGWSSFTALGDYVFTQEQRGEDELVVCYRAETGEPVWANRISERFNDPQGTGPRATPTFDDGKLYVQGATGIVQCLEASTGKSVWKRDLKTDANAKKPVWGFASSPLVVDDRVIVFAGGPDGKSVIAYNKTSGDIAWTAGDGTHGYCSGHLAQIDGVSQVLMSSDVGIRSYTPDTGELLWKNDWLTTTNPRCTQPIITNANTIMIGTAGGQGARQLVVTKDEAGWNVQENWTTRKFRPYFNDSVYHEGHLYGYDGARFMCIDAATGERKWRGDKFGGQVLLLSDMKTLLVLTEKGDVVLFEATPEGNTEIARIKALTGKTWNHPVVAHGRLFVRNSEEAVCYKLPS